MNVSKPLKGRSEERGGELMAAKFIPISCERCGARLKVLRGAETYYCDHCDCEYFLDDDSRNYVERIYDDAEVINAQAKAEFSHAMSNAERFIYVLTHVVWALLFVIAAVGGIMFAIVSSPGAIGLCIWASALFVFVTYYLLSK